MDSRIDEQTRGITLKLSFAVINRFSKDNLCEHIIIDTPGHVDFESLIQISSLISTFFILIIDVNEGITPRLFSILSHIKKQKIILVINKIDKILFEESKDIYYIIEAIISKINNLLDHDFEWDNNNVMLAWSTNCAGISKRKNLIKECSLLQGIKMFQEIQNRIKSGQSKKLIEKFNIKKKSEKDIWMGIMPLADVIFDAIENFDEENKNSLQESFSNEINLETKKIDKITLNNTNKIFYDNKSINDDDNKSKDDDENNIKNINESQIFINFKDKEDDEINKETNKINKMEFLFENLELNENNTKSYIEKFIYINKNNLFAVTMFCVLKNKNLIRENVLFVTRIFTGKLKKGITVLNKNNSEERNVVINNIYVFKSNELISVDEVEGISIVALDGDFLRYSIIMQDIENKINFSSFLSYFQIKSKPFFRAKLLLLENKKKEFIEALKVISFLEPVFKVKLNKFCEYEICCEGKVQFEKIINDLKEENFQFEVKDDNKIFCESIGKKSEISSANFILKISELNTNVELNIHKNCIIYKKKENRLIFYDNQYKDLIQSAFDFFIAKGPLINEKIKFIDVCLLIDDQIDSIDFQIIKKRMLECYNNSEPLMIPFYYICKIKSQSDYLNQVYLSLRKHHYILISENFDQKSEFFVIDVYIPQFCYYSFVDDIRMKSKGTVYLEVDEFDFIKNESNNFNFFVNEFRKEKGLFVNEQIVVDPEKQRTLKK
ncbi:Cytoplasmic GTPase/eEF2-like protein (ribosomal biogenesis) [Gurleya vavrai]